ncbi:MAG: molybdenum cofactor guanylyltransferase [Verrucomicrobiota bacterium]
MAVSPTQLAAVLLTGGRSKRMGQDKAFLTCAPNKNPLWLLQLKKLHALNPAHLHIAAHPDQHFPPETLAPLNATVQPDPDPHSGPLAAFLSCPADFLLPLAVDMPALPVETLQNLITTAHPQKGLVFQDDDHNRYQPFPALYPSAITTLAHEKLDRGELSIQGLIKEAVARDILHSQPLPAKLTLLFTSINTPEDLASLHHSPS